MTSPRQANRASGALLALVCSRLLACGSPPTAAPAGDRDAKAPLDAEASVDVEAPPEAAADVGAPRDATADAPRDATTDAPRDATADAPRDATTDAPRDGARACVRSVDCPNDDFCSVAPTCDPVAGVCRYAVRDEDGDGEPAAACGGRDCDDVRPAVRPGAPERCDGLDNNCDGRVDEEGASPLCDGGACAGGRCVCAAPGAALCDGRCVDVTADASHCGRCGNACPAGSACVAGACACAAGRSRCGAECVDVQTSGSHCGACGRACTAPAGVLVSCEAATCRVSCLTGRGDCDGMTANGCETDLQVERAHCGSCGRACPTGVSCVAGSCGGEGWTRTFSAGTVTTVRGVAATEGGDVYVSGTFGGSLTFGATTRTAVGGYDVFVAAFDRLGAPRWIRSFGGASDDSTGEVAVDAAGNVYVTGQVVRDADLGDGVTRGGAAESLYVTSFTAAGTFRWARRYGEGFNCRGVDLFVDATGGVYVAGAFTGVTDFGGGAIDPRGVRAAGVVLALTSGGGFRWALPVTTSIFASVASVAFDAAGNGVAAVQFEGDATARGTTVRAVGSADAALLGITSAGALRWARAWGGSGYDTVGGVALAASGDAYVVGGFASPTVSFGADVLRNGSIEATASDAYLMVLSATGAPLAARRFGGIRGDVAGEVLVDGRGDIFVGGTFASRVDFGGVPLSASGGGDGFLVQLSGLDMARQGWRWGGGTEDWVDDVALHSGGVIVVGAYSGAASFGGTVIPARGVYDGFVTRLPL